jgi:MEMO1 family protein
MRLPAWPTILLICAGIIVLSLGSPAQQTVEIIKQPAVAGSWYPADRQALALAVSSYFRSTANQNLGAVRALIVPHAGYDYSGRVAAAAFAQISGDYENVFILGPSHYYPLSGLAIDNATVFRTPLGDVAVSKKMSEIRNEPGMREIPEAFEKEHSIEAELPFLQTKLHSPVIVPMLIGETDTKALAALLEKYYGARDLMIVSADLSHYHDRADASALDEYTIGRILALDSSGIMSAEIDAPSAVAALLRIAKSNDWTPHLVYYADSGDVTGDPSSVVGYAAIVFTENSVVGDNDQNFLLNLSRLVLDSYVKTGRVPSINEKDVPAALLEETGCFVTLNKNGQLRGCIGNLMPRQPLYRCVIENTVNAAANDGRFNPVSADELVGIKIEISVLTPPLSFPYHGAALKDNLTAEDGVILKQGDRESTYLPQVWHTIADKDVFLTTLCEKGGMAPDCWTSADTEVYTYGDFVFSEK